MRSKLICLTFMLFFLSQANAQLNEKGLTNMCPIFSDQHHKIKVKCAGMANESSCNSANAIDFMRKLGGALKKEAESKGEKVGDPILLVAKVNEFCERKGHVSLNSLAFENDFEKSMYFSLIEDLTQTKPAKKLEPKSNQDNNVWRDMGNGYELNLQTGDIQVKRIR